MYYYHTLLPTMMDWTRNCDGKDEEGVRSDRGREWGGGESGGAGGGGRKLTLVPRIASFIALEYVSLDPYLGYEWSGRRGGEGIFHPPPSSLLPPPPTHHWYLFVN